MYSICFHPFVEPLEKSSQTIETIHRTSGRLWLIRFFNQTVRRTPVWNRTINDDKVFAWFETTTLTTNANIKKKAKSRSPRKTIYTYIRELCTGGYREEIDTLAAVTTRGGSFGLRIMVPVGCTQVVPLKMQYNFLRVNSYVFSNSLFTRFEVTETLRWRKKNTNVYGNNVVSTLA